VRYLDVLRFGTFAPFLRASERPIAIACFRLFTFPPRPPGPERSVPRFRRRIALSTRLDAALPYRRPERRGRVRFVVAISTSLSRSLGRILRHRSGRARIVRLGAPTNDTKHECTVRMARDSAHREDGKNQVFHLDEHALGRQSLRAQSLDFNADEGAESAEPGARLTVEPRVGDSLWLLGQHIEKSAAESITIVQ
jgi:hypothetical protein